MLMVHSDIIVIYICYVCDNLGGLSSLVLLSEASHVICQLLDAQVRDRYVEADSAATPASMSLDLDNAFLSRLSHEFLLQFLLAFQVEGHRDTRSLVLDHVVKVETVRIIDGLVDQ
jgi:hypothetical protein